MEPKKKAKPEGELEVTGVSRSGRVRKKSSKLMDFDSTDDPQPEKRPYHKKSDQISPLGTAPPRRGRPPSQHSPLKAFSSLALQHGNIAPPEYTPRPPNILEEYKQQEVASHQEVSMSDVELYHSGDQTVTSSLPSGGGPDDFDGDSSLDGDSIGSEFNDSLLIDDHDDDPDDLMQDESLFMIDGKPAPKKRGPKSPRKNQRKDKGKARFTAYMLWAKQIRQKLITSNPEMDFSQVSKKLGELWHTVPSGEKYSWKRQADRLAAKYTHKMTKTGRSQSQKTKSTYTPQGKATLNKQTVEAVIETRPSPPDTQRVLIKPTLPSDLFKVTGMAPLDIAAHLKLLGDNLTIIGERLKDHEGRMAISGSMSLLMDSFLCALGPLLCLTTQVPQLNACPQDILAHILDNIAYIMPGL